MDDSIEKICQVLNVKSNTIFTFDEFIQNEFNKPYNEIKDREDVKALRHAWNTSCNSLLQIISELRLMAKGIKK
jgi:hypothetical protein